MHALDRFRTGFENIRIPKKMKALVLSGKGFDNVGIKEVDVPCPGPGQLLARVDAAGVCTSILKIVEQAEKHTYLNGWDPSKWPLVLGDEGALTLVKIGQDLKGTYNPGERYGIQPAVEVGPINFRQRYNNNGEGMVKTAVGYTLGGQLAGYVLIQEEVLEGGCLIRIPDTTMPYFAVSMAEPISCVISAQSRQVHIYKDSPQSQRHAELGIKKGGTCMIVGAGGMGKIHAELAMRFQPANLIVSDPIQERLDWVKKVLGPKAESKGIRLETAIPENTSEILKKVSNGTLADDIILAVGIREVQQNALQWLGNGGVANSFGGLKRGDSMLEVDGIRIHYDEIKIVGSSGGDPADYQETLKAIINNDIDPGNYVAGVGSLDNAVKVLEMIRNNKIQGKVILYPHIRQTDLIIVESWDKEREEQFLNEHLT